MITVLILTVMFAVLIGLAVHAWIPDCSVWKTPWQYRRDIARARSDADAYGRRYGPK